MAAIDPTSLDSLVDIVVPPAAGGWPPAPGWIVIAAALSLGGLFRLFLWGRNWRRNAYRREAFHELDRIAASPTPETWPDLPPLLKRTALAAWPRAEVASLSGTDWIDFLNGGGGSPVFTMSVGQRLTALSYEPDAAAKFSKAEFQELVEACRAWIARHAPPEAGAC
jgi:hypothetical protein